MDRLVCEAATKSYGTRFTLGPISAEIGPGVTCLVGANGAGKSTFFRLVARIERPTSGSVRLDGTGGKMDLGYLPQDPHLPGATSCEELLSYVAWLQKIPKSRRNGSISEALESVGLSDQASTRIRALSGGMRRRLGVAHALVHRPRLLLLDEPTVGLDPRQRVSLRTTIKGISEDRIVIVSTHLVEDVRGLADRVIVISDGQFFFDGDIKSLEQKAEPGAPGDTDLERAISTLIGRDV